MRTAKSCGSDAPMLASSSCGCASIQVDRARDPRDDGGKQAGRREEHVISRKPLRREGRMPPLNLYARVRVFVQFCTRDRGCSAHPVFPAPSVFYEGAKLTQTSGGSRRENASAYLLFEI